MGYVGKVAGELGPKRPVQLVLGHELSLDRRRNLALAVEWTARGEADEEEGQGDNRKKNKNQRREALEDEL